MNLDLSCLLDDVSPREARVLDRIAVDVAAARRQAVDDAQDAARVARVCAAVPELLKACEGALLGVTRHPDDTYTIGANAVRILQDAIARAEGRA